MTNTISSTAKLLNAKQSAQYTGMSVWKLRRLTKAGKIPYVPGEGKTSPWMWAVEALDEFVKQAQVRMGDNDGKI